MATRAEHVKWCQGRALEHVELGDLQYAYASMISDLGKHESIAQALTPQVIALGRMEMQRGPDALRQWIEGFSE